jgi:hypothetical protein
VRGSKTDRQTNREHDPFPAASPVHTVAHIQCNYGHANESPSSSCALGEGDGDGEEGAGQCQMLAIT